MRRLARGFTLIELMISLTVLAIILTVAVPSMATMLQNARLASAASDAVSVLNTARSYAINHRATITVTPVSAWIDGFRVEQGDTELLQIEGTGLPASSTTDNITFLATGIITASPDWALTLCDARGKGRLVTVAKSGAIAVAAIDAGCTL